MWLYALSTDAKKNLIKNVPFLVATTRWKEFILYILRTTAATIGLDGGPYLIYSL